MANSKHAHLRYTILDYFFLNKSYDFEELLKVLNERIAEIYPGEGILERSLRENVKLFRDKANGFDGTLPESIYILIPTLASHKDLYINMNNS